MKTEILALLLTLVVFAMSPIIVNADQSAETTVNVIPALKSFSIDYNKVDFGTIKAGFISNVPGDYHHILNDGKPTLWNNGEVNMTVVISATTMTLTAGGETTGSISNDDIVLTMTGILPESPTPVVVAAGGLYAPMHTYLLRRGVNYSMEYDLAVPEDAVGGIYKGNIDIIGE